MRRKQILKQSKKILVAALIGTMMVTACPSMTQAAAWKRDSKGWWWREDNGSYPVSQWKKINGKWYWFNAKGYMVTGWQKISGKWYYFESNGKMLQSTWKKINGKYYYFRSSGCMATGWVKVGNKWYYLDQKSGAMYGKGWHWIEGKCYYMNGNGEMAADTWIDGYYVDASGVYQKVEQKDFYAKVFEEYQEALKAYKTGGAEAISGKFSYVSEYLVAQKVKRKTAISYGYYDIDGNGVEELLMGYDVITGTVYKIVDVFSLDGKQIRKIGNENTFSQYTGSAIYQNGVIYSSEGNQDNYYKIGADGYSLYKITPPAKLGKEITVEWKKLEENSSEENYRYSSGELVSELSIKENKAYLGFWHNYGQTSSDEDFMFEWVDGQNEYEIIGNRSRKKFKITFNKNGDKMQIVVKCMDGMYFSWTKGTSAVLWSDEVYMKK